MKLYGNYVLYIDGALQGEVQNVESELVSDDQEVMTIALGFSGVTPAPDMRRTTWTSASPVEGEDYDYEAAKLNRTSLKIKLQQVGSGKTVTSTGIIKSVRRRGAVGETSSLEVEFLGTASAMA